MLDVAEAAALASAQRAKTSAQFPEDEANAAWLAKLDAATSCRSVCTVYPQPAAACRGGGVDGS